ncbi:MAG: hypothetical protein LBN29_02970 [Mediterranea sp.]|jgi:hypothetical protein|nr:hypothetical protein [Mediterranea sp.]
MSRTNHLILTLSLMTVFGAARAQVTPEAIIGQAPDLPSVAHLAAIIQDEAAYDAASAARTAFHANIAALREKLDEAIERTQAGGEAAAMSDAERIARQTTGRSVSQLRNMSKADEDKLAREMVAKRLGAAGLGGMTLKQLQALEGKSDEEIMSAISAGGATVGSHTMEDIQATEKMTDAQARVDASAEMKRITDRWAEIDRVNENEIRDVVAKLAELDAKYGLQYPPNWGDIMESGTAAQIEATSRTVNGIRRAENSEKFTLWRNAVSRMQGRVKTKMADVARYDELLAQTMTSGGMTTTARRMPSIGYEIARQYLNLTSRVTELPEAT